jgi:hypothetical protein
MDSALYFYDYTERAPGAFVKWKMVQIFISKVVH